MFSSAKRSLLLLIPVFALLLASVSWNTWQHRLGRDHRAQAEAAERANKAAVVVLVKEAANRQPRQTQEASP
jgi:hypothetical protein